MDKVVIPADQFVENLFNSMPPTRLGIAIGIANETSYKWSGTNAFFFSGKPGQITSLPEFVEIDQVAPFTATKRTGWPSGSAGVITFFIPDKDVTVAVMFSVPFSRPMYENWWNAKVYRNKKEADKDMWSQMYYWQEPFKGDDGWHEKEIGEGYRVKGYMTSLSRCKLQLKVWNDKVYRNKKEADKGMSSQMDYQEPFEGDNGCYEEEIGEGYHVEGIMTSSSRRKLQLKISKPKPLPTVTHRNSCFERLIERVVSSFRHRKIVPSSLPKAN